MLYASSFIMQQHFCLQDIELSIFRTQVCEQHRNGTCRNADRCFWSHCESWQVRSLDVEIKKNYEIYCLFPEAKPKRFLLFVRQSASSV